MFVRSAQITSWNFLDLCFLSPLSRSFLRCNLPSVSEVWSGKKDWILQLWVLLGKYLLSFHFLKVCKLSFTIKPIFYFILFFENFMRVYIQWRNCLSPLDTSPSWLHLLLLFLFLILFFHTLSPASAAHMCTDTESSRRKIIHPLAFAINCQKLHGKTPCLKFISLICV